MKIKREGEKVMFLRNKRKGLRLVIREDTDPELPCQYNCYLWNHSWCKGRPCEKMGLWGSYHFIKDR